MNRVEAVALYKEIITLCQDLAATAVSLVESKPDDPTIEGYQIRINATLDTESAKQIKIIARKYKLILKEEKDEIIIFKSK
jgi:hypothetical protein